ncbi:phosphatidylserine decarboxylase [Deinococcus metalli]|uniref:Phosphatidylserine decarboxylase n=1 Tax=Deinococcus metalli TaxID=1141878 RepID=A0A7W8KGL2_9DEIO|nr:phosphatidylserine decarboxylase [Deinococcus metalli]MBB5377747.1 phosphatidylserine decarboxylase [Deinococcus metalli]GHF53038.1 hypothetical protein GCM10017781_31760 [Deinococcus metalli]
MRLRRLFPLVAAGLAAVYVRQVHRFRDPVRVLGAADGEVVSPADGVVAFVRRVEAGEVTAGTNGAAVPVQEVLGTAAEDGWLLGVLIGPLDVHYTYQPVSGTVTGVRRMDGRTPTPLLTLLARAALLAGRPTDVLGAPGTRNNERLSVTLGSDAGDVTVALVAPGAALDAMPYVKEGDRARAGNKLAFLPQGGLVLLHLPGHLTPLVTVGEHVTGMQTVVARS